MHGRADGRNGYRPVDSAAGRSLRQSGPGTPGPARWARHDHRGRRPAGYLHDHGAVDRIRSDRRQQLRAEGPAMNFAIAQRAPRRARMLGMSLIELMTAVVIGLLLIAGALTVYM